MRCKTCNSILHYHTSGVTCRNCGFKIGHEFLLEAKCQSCHNVLEGDRDLCILFIRYTERYAIIGEHVHGQGEYNRENCSGNLIINPAGADIWKRMPPTGRPFQVAPFYFKDILNYLISMATRAIAKTIIGT